MTQSKHGVRFILTAMLACLILVMMEQSVSAADTNTLTLHYSLDGTTFSVYRVGEYTDQYTLTGLFADYAVEVPGEGWREAAATLEAYVLRDGIEPDASGQVSGGKLVLTGLEEGLYLILGETGSDEDYVYTPVASLVLIEEDLTIEVKYDRTEIEKETVSYTVKKVWASDSGSVRPNSVKIQLLDEDGTVRDTVTLSSKNRWQYTWTGLDANTAWKVTEAEVPDGYTVSVSLEDTIYTVTNTYHETDEETPEEEEEESEPTDPGTSTEAESTDGAQTGDTAPINALLTVVLAAGVVILLLLFVKRKQKDEESEVK